VFISVERDALESLQVLDESFFSQALAPDRQEVDAMTQEAPAALILKIWRDLSGGWHPYNRSLL
jgi:hypothetical protein